LFKSFFLGSRWLVYWRDFYAAAGLRLGFITRAADTNTGPGLRLNNGRGNGQSDRQWAPETISLVDITN